MRCKPLAAVRDGLEAGQACSLPPVACCPSRRPSGRPSLNLAEMLDVSRAVPKRLLTYAEAIEQREIQIRHGCAIRVAQVTARYQGAAAAAYQQHRKVL